MTITLKPKYVPYPYTFTPQQQQEAIKRGWLLVHACCTKSGLLTGGRCPFHAKKRT